jgi:putative tryptophan/tyrosine transport system substrate-binding protein
MFGRAEIASFKNTTGVYLEFTPEAQPALIKRLFPQIRRPGVLYSMENKLGVAEAAMIAQTYGLELMTEEVFTPKDIPRALAFTEKKADMLWGLMDKVVLAPEMAKQILLFSMRHQVPFIGPSENWAKAGAVAAFGWNFEDIGLQCAEIFLNLHKGAKASELAPARARKMEYALNLKTAEQMKLEFSPEVISGAKWVFRGE